MKFSYGQPFLVMVVGLLCITMTYAQKYQHDTLEEVKVKTTLLDSKDIASEQAARLPIKDLENPQVTNTLSGKLLNNRNYNLIFNMLSNVAGVASAWAGEAPYYSIRGFRTNANFRNGVDGYVAYDIDPANIQQLDVVKGPTGTLFGGTMTTFGGVINRITYKPQDSLFTQISIAGGNNNMQRATFDFNSTLDKNGQALFRIIGAYNYKEGFQDQGLNKSFFIAPSFSYQANSKLKLSLDADIFHRSSVNVSMVQPANPLANGILVNPDNSKDLGLDYKRTFTDNSLQWNTMTVNLYGKAVYNISDKWRSETNVVSTNSQSNGYYQTNTMIQHDSSLIRKVVTYNPENITSQQIQQNFIGDFKIGNIRNRLVVGLEYFHYIYSIVSKSLSSFDTVALYGSNPNYGMLTAQTVDTKLLNTTPTRTKTEYATYSAYFSDVINPIEALSVMVSARIDRNINQGTLNQLTGVKSDSYNQTSFSPKLGVTYQIIPKYLAVFGNYMNGFQNVAPMSQIDGSVSNFKPEYGNQLEGGLKFDYNKYLTGSICYYDINVSNVVRSNPDDISMYIQDGKQYSRGVELDVQSNPISSFFVHVGGAYNNSKLSVSDANTQGLRPINSGPAWMGNVYINYAIQHGNLQGLSFGLGGNYNGKTVIINSKSAGQFYTNAYSIANAVISYEKSRYVWTLSADNLFNEHYYYGSRGFITQGFLRQVVASFKIRM
ncbi:TonB-dependent siderophore receptor [Rhizosphaericola mali]|uniref:TonB-dependent receptor n=1 Tax=Rhizosphaericola mali TaxID=2545455 RepID=A0A5P2G1B1_9BACT|nr:TonB-dependent receptor [Rhizosphaericola mali]QES89584.1 TonB-dependent receptor [Rhizosphaericola mali]